MNHTIVGKIASVDAHALGKGATDVANVVGKVASVDAHALGEGITDVAHAVDNTVNKVGDALSNVFVPKIGPNPIDVGPDIEGVISSSYKAVAYFGKALCQIIDLGIQEIGPNVPIDDPAACDIPGTD